MTERPSDTELTLQAALTAYAQRLVLDGAPAPAPRFAEQAVRARPRGARSLMPAAAAASVVGVIGAVALVGSHGSAWHGHGPATAGQTPSVAASVAAAKAVHVRLLNDDGAQYGVGMPVIAYFSRAVTDARPLQQATTVTIDGVAAHGGWYFEQSAAGKGPLEAHFRLAGYWPAHSVVQVSLSIKGLSAGNGLTYDDSLSTTFRTGAADIATVDARRRQLTLVRDGKPIGPFPVSLGPSTRPGTKVVMERPGSVTMRVDGRLRPVRDAQRLTYAGEFLLAAPWNRRHIDHGQDVSNGSTDLLPADARRLFALMQVGDVVIFKGTSGVPMTVGSGYGDWNLPWSTWLTGGAVPTR